MTRTEHLAFCSKCTNRKTDFDKGIVCSLTMEHADFIDYCPDFSTDPKELKIQLENAETILEDKAGLSRRFKTSKILNDFKNQNFRNEFTEKKGLFNFWKSELKPVLTLTELGFQHKDQFYRWSQVIDSQITQFNTSNSTVWTLQLVIYPSQLIQISIGEQFHIPFFNNITGLDGTPEEIGASLEHHKLKFWKNHKGV
ncbi:hypothetical protein [Ekhidna sp.]|uniref:hypothetical protein n=1 Tax=Ekhidna sp. TaxID=2608089 RepID=UPI003CCBFC2A